MNLLRAIDQVGAKFAQALIPIRNSRTQDASHLLGTAFFAHFEGNCYLVTAMHVLLEGMKRRQAYIELSGQPFTLDDQIFFYCPANDVGVFKVEGHFKKLTKAVPRIPIERELAFFADGAQGTVLIGFPYLFRPDDMTTAVPISTCLEVRDIKTSTTIVDAKIYWFNDDMLITTDERTRIYNLDAHGMSGGPAVAWVNRGSEANPTLEAKLQAVLVQWHSSDRYLVGAKTAALVELIDRTLVGKAPHV